MAFAHYQIGWKYPGAPPCKLMLLALAEHTDKNGCCWPSIARLSTMTGYHRSTVMRTLVELERAGKITRARHRGKATRYRLVAECDPSQGATGSTGQHDQSQSATPPVAASDATGGTARPEPINEPISESTSEPKTGRVLSIENGDAD